MLQLKVFVVLDFPCNRSLHALTLHQRKSPQNWPHDRWAQPPRKTAAAVYADKLYSGFMSMWSAC